MLLRSVTRPLTVVLIAAGLAVPAAAAWAAPTQTKAVVDLDGPGLVNESVDPPISMTHVVVPMAFPVVGTVSYSDTFLACRGTNCSRKHLGQDLMSAKMSPLVAAFSGTVTYVKRETYVGEGNYISIQSLDKAWSVNYLHMNNDTPHTDDGKGTTNFAFLPGLHVGQRVARGQLVGWVGDSGNAESTGSHCHFELRKGNAWSGTVFNAYYSLRAAIRMPAALVAGPHQPGELVKWAGGPAFLLTADGGRQAVSESMLLAHGWRDDDVVTISGGEMMMYPYEGIAPLREGSIVKATDGTLWATAGGKRYVVNAAQLTALGDLPVEGAFAVTDADLTGTPAAAGAVPGGKYRNGAIFHEAGDPQVWVMAGGQRHPVHQGVWHFWGIPAGQIGTFPVGTLSGSGVPAQGAIMAYEDGTIYRTPSTGTFMLVGGVRRQITNLNAQVYYNWSSKRQFWCYDALSNMLPLGAPIA